LISRTVSRISTFWIVMVDEADNHAALDQMENQADVTAGTS